MLFGALISLNLYLSLSPNVQIILWRALGSVLERPKHPLESSWRRLGDSSASSGSSRRCLGDSLSRLGGSWNLERLPLERLGRSGGVLGALGVGPGPGGVQEASWTLLVEEPSWEP